MTNKPTITFVTVCKARLAHLMQSLPAAAAQAPCVVVDYACPEATGNWVRANHPAVTVVGIGTTGRFSVAAGRNAGAAAAATDWLCFLDADVIPASNFVEALTLLLRPGRFYRPLPVTEDTWGTLLCTRTDFERIGGYDEAFEEWGGEDDDIYHRLQSSGVTAAHYPAHLLSAITHDDSVRMQFHVVKDREISRRVNFAYMQLRNDIRTMLDTEPGLPLRRAVFSEVRRVLSASLPAGSDARISVDLPDAVLLPGWNAARALVYTLPPSPLTPPLSDARGSMQLRNITDRPQMPFIVGTGRCGSTLLRLMLDSHPALAIPDEAIFMRDLVRAAMQGAGIDELMTVLVSHHSWKSFGLDAREVRARLTSTGGPPLAAVLRAFYDCYATRFSKSRSGDKTIVNTQYIALLAAVLPEARFIHLVRDGRDVAVSMRGLWFGMDNLADAAAYWATTILHVRSAIDSSRCLEIRYEDLVADPESALRRICEFIELSWDPKMLDYHVRAADRLAESPDGIAWDGTRVPAIETNRAHALTKQPPTKARVGTWKNTLTSDEVTQFELLAGPVLATLGYETST